jgi:hypothetical protein
VNGGAIAYLSQSIYGKEDEISVNTDAYYTGGGIQKAYINNTSQTTTGNIYGIYDLSGGSSEMIAGYLLTHAVLEQIKNGNEIGLISDRNTISIEDSTKYVTIYQVGTNDDSQSNYIANTYESSPYKYGDAIYETSSDTNSQNGWYQDIVFFPYTTSPYFSRGYFYDKGSSSGSYSCICYSGNASPYHSFRVILAK